MNIVVVVGAIRYYDDDGLLGARDCLHIPIISTRVPLLSPRPPPANRSAITTAHGYILTCE